VTSIHRVTSGSASRTVLANLQNSLSRVQKLQDQLSSGKVIQRASDDPAGALQSMQDRSAIRRASQYSRNADDGLSWLNTADSSLQSVLTSVSRVRDLVLQGGNGSLSQSDRNAIASEVDALRDGLVQVANTQYLDRPIFGGTSTASAAFTQSGTTVTYAGNTLPVQRTAAPGVQVPVSVDGVAVFGPDGGNLFDTLNQISADLRSGNITNLTSADLGALDAHRNTVQDVLSTVGARTNRLETLKKLADANHDDLTTRLSAVEDVDLPKTIMDLQLQQTSYQAALSAGAKVLQPSLVDFLR
jgi:flagellar hook-associated protein 3 FlgL